jgi:predicted RNase H-like HicB family nuclease
MATRGSNHSYSLKLEEHEDGYLAYFPALPGCHTWGHTYQEAVGNAEEALVGYLEALRRAGDKIPEERPVEGVVLGLMVMMPTIV